MRILITAGGTREYIDPVRYITNASSGRMGYALSEKAWEPGHEVVLISAPSVLQAPQGVRLINVVTSDDMFQAVKAEYAGCDCLIMAAAVSDYRPARSSATKLKKKLDRVTLELEPTQDILQWAGDNKQRQLLVGFALEDQDLLENAEAKFLKKKLDMIVANEPTAINAVVSSVHVLTHQASWVSLKNADKTLIAEFLIKNIENLKF